MQERSKLLQQNSRYSKLFWNT